MPRIIITEPGSTPQPYRLKIDRSITKIGRASDNDVIISEPSASSHHCEIKRVEGGFILKDNGSTNGIKEKDVKYSVIDLQDGKTVQIGDHIDLEFTLTEEEIAELQQENFESHQQASFPKNKKPQAKEKVAVEPQPDKDQDEDAVELKEAKPKSKQPAATRPRPTSSRSVPNRVQSAQTSSSGLSFIIFMVLAVLFFVAGLAIRHFQDHGTFIFS